MHIKLSSVSRLLTPVLFSCAEMRQVAIFSLNASDHAAYASRFSLASHSFNPQALMQGSWNMELQVLWRNFCLSNTQKICYTWFYLNVLQALCCLDICRSSFCITSLRSLPVLPSLS